MRNTSQQLLKSSRPSAPLSFLLPPQWELCVRIRIPQPSWVFLPYHLHLLKPTMKVYRTERIRGKRSATSALSLLKYLSDHMDIRKPEGSHEALTYIQRKCVRLGNRNQLTTSVGASLAPGVLLSDESKYIQGLEYAWVVSVAFSGWMGYCQVC